MEFGKSLSNILSSLFIGFSILIIISIILLGQLDKELSNPDIILEESFTELFEEDQDILKESLSENQNGQNFIEMCEAGTLTEEDCNLSIDNPLISENFKKQKEEFKQSYLDNFNFIKDLLNFKQSIITLGIIFFLLGCFLLAFSLEYNLTNFIRKLNLKLAFIFTLLFLSVKYLLNNTKYTYIDLITSKAPDVSYIIGLYISIILHKILTKVFEPFYLPLLILSLSFILITLSFYIRLKLKKPTNKKQNIKKTTSK